VPDACVEHDQAADAPGEGEADAGDEGGGGRGGGAQGGTRRGLITVVTSVVMKVFVQTWKEYCTGMTMTVEMSAESKRARVSLDLLAEQNL
jgi:hypothetical protein